MSNIRDSGLHKLLLKGRRYKLAKQQIIQSTEDRRVVNLIVSGFFRKYLIDNEGNIGVQIVYGPGDIFPITLVYKTMFNQSLYSGLETFFYEAMSEAEVYSISSEQLKEAVKQQPELYQDLLQETGRHLEFCIHSLENLSLNKSEKRIAHLLWYMALKFGTQTKSGTRIDIPLTHQAIGEVLNVTRETVTVYIKNLRDKGLISHDRYIIVPNLKKLQEEAYA
jgi:CRP-like cAMP-binding protein